MTIPSGKGLRLGPETADPAGAPMGTRLSRSLANDASAVHGETAEGFYMGEVNTKDPLFDNNFTGSMAGRTSEGRYHGETDTKAPAIR